MTAGFQLSADGVQIIGFCDVATGEGLKTPARDASLRAGDNIVRADGYKITCIGDLNAALKKGNGAEMLLTVARGKEEEEVRVKPVRDANGNFKLGILIRDSISGIGTVTYIDKQTLRFGSLGHAVLDENANLMSLSDSKVYPCSVIGVTKGVRGRAGELKGLFVNGNQFAEAEKVCEKGIYGTFSAEYDFSSCQTVAVAEEEEAHIGKAVIYSTVSGTLPQEYTISIVKVDKKNKENKNFVVKITDETLLGATGGIVQGMSCSPILQDGIFVGAITHVFLNDPTRGYGIAVENMLEE